MNQWIFYMSLAAVLGGCLSLPVGLAFWAALSNRKPLTRLSVVLGMIVCLGFFFDFSQPDGDRLGALLILCVLGGMIWVIPIRWLQVLAGLAMGVFAVWCLSRAVSYEKTEWASIGLVGMPLFAISSCVAVLRLLGFRVLKLTGQYTDREVEIGTGRSLDDWVHLFARENGLELKREEIVRIAREDGAPFSWQRVIADAIDVVAGRTIVGIDEVGRPQTIAEKAHVGILDLLAPRAGRFRWSIAQVMVLSLAVAVVAAVVRALEVPLPDLLESFFLFAISVAFAVIGSAVVYALLNLHRRWQGDLACAGIIVMTSIAANCIWSFHPAFTGWASGLVTMVLPGFLGFATVFALGTILIRHHGYRLVLVGRGLSPAID